jgi:hypothetical protein
MTDENATGGIEPVPPGGTAQGDQSVSADERKRKVANQIRTEVTQGGRVESQGDYDAVIATGKEINHTVHLIATIFTCGIWGLVWLVIALTGGIKRKMISVDEYGQLLVQNINTK